MRADRPRRAESKKQPSHMWEGCFFVAYLRPPRRELRRSDWRSSDSLLSEAAINCLSRHVHPEPAAGVPAGAAHGTALTRGAGRGIHSLFDGEVDAAVLVNADDLDLDLLPFLEMILHIVDIGIGDL